MILVLLHFYYVNELYKADVQISLKFYFWIYFQRNNYYSIKTDSGEERYASDKLLSKPVLWLLKPDWSRIKVIQKRLSNFRVVLLIGCLINHYYATIKIIIVEFH